MGSGVIRCSASMCSWAFWRCETGPVPTAGNTGRKGFCADHAALILAKFEAGLTAQKDLPGALSLELLCRFLDSALREEPAAPAQTGRKRAKPPY